MTNEEKAKEIAEKTIGDAATSFLGWINEMSVTFCELSAREMAKWKDQQFKEYLEKKKEENPLFYRSDWKSYENGIYHDIINEIINELFEETEQDNSDREE